jgi:hypothetical protein
VNEHQLLAAVNRGESPGTLTIGCLNGDEPEIGVERSGFVDVGHPDGEPRQSVKCHVMLLCSDRSVAVRFPYVRCCGFLLARSSLPAGGKDLVERVSQDRRQS